METPRPEEIVNVNTMGHIPTFFTTNDETTVFNIIPARFAPWPTIDPSMVNAEFFTLPSHEDVVNYFVEVLDEDCRLDVFNGIILHDSDIYACEYCRNTVEGNTWYYCNTCYKDMCVSCHETRCNDATKCENHQVVVRNLPSSHQFWSGHYCDLCSVQMNDQSFYSTPDHYDICMTCYQNNEEARATVAEKKMVLVNKNDPACYPFHFTGFKSMLYWFPILEDDEKCCVLMNLNADDEHCGKLCVRSCDDHGRYGYFMIYDESITLDVLLRELKVIADNGTFEYEDSVEVEPAVYGDLVKVEVRNQNGKQCYTKRRKQLKPAVYQNMTIIKKIGSEHHSSPIQLWMREHGIPVYYG